MRGSKCKLLRKIVKQDAVHLPERAYKEGASPTYAKIDGKLFKTAKGVPRTLEQKCQRAIYKQMKRFM